MVESRFCNLHLHSHFSIMDSLSDPKEIVSTAKKFGQTACALTDHGNIGGAIKFYQECKKQGIKPILGEEFYLMEDYEIWRSEKRRHAHHLVILAENETGWRNIIKLTTKANENFYFRPNIDFKLLKEHNEGLIVLTACMSGPVAYYLYDKEKEIKGDNGEVSMLKTPADIPQAECYIKMLKDAVLPGNLFLEVQDGDIDEQRIINKNMRELAKKYDLPTVCTLDAHYIFPGDAEAHDYLKNIAYGSKVISAESGNSFKTKAFYMKDIRWGEYIPEDTEPLENQFFYDGDWTGFFGTDDTRAPDFTLDELENTGRIADRCNVELDFSKTKIPTITEDAPAKLKEDCNQALIDKELDNNEYRARLEHELNVINELGFADYFLLMADIMAFAKSKGIRTGPGRGSAGGCLVSYLLGITKIDPLEHGLIFSRFLNKGRAGSVPDIDVDFDRERREEIIEYIKERFGRDRVAQIGTFNTMTAKAALKDVFRAGGLSFAEANTITSLVPAKDDDHSGITIDRAIEKVPALAVYEKKYQKLFDIARRLEGCVKSLGKHAAGILISDVSFTEGNVPLVRPANSKDDLVCGWDMDTIDALKMLKVDILGLNTLSIQDTCLHLIEVRHGIEVDIDNLSMDDELTYDIMCEGRNIGVFQLESNLGINYSTKIKPHNIREISDLISLIRPMCLDSGLTDNYINLKNSDDKPEYLHPKLESILEDTQGQLVYQEQLIQICSQLGGLSLEEADSYRKICGKKLTKEIKKHKNNLIQSFYDHSGVPKDVGEKIWDWFEKSAGYSFNRSHGVAYAIIAYQTAYLKAHYPVEFFCANLKMSKHAQDSMEEIAKIVNDAKLFGITVMPPDVSKSEQEVDFSILDDHTILFGLQHIKSIGEKAADSILKLAAKCNSFVDFISLANKYKITRTHIDALIKVNALRGFGPQHALLREFALSEMLTSKEMQERTNFSIDFSSTRDYAEYISREDNVDDRKAKKQFVPNKNRRLKLRNSLSALFVEPIDLLQQLSYEKFYLGITLSGSETSIYRGMSKATHACRDIPHTMEGENVNIAIIVEDIRETVTKKGKNPGSPMAFVRGGDSSYILDGIVVFPNQYEKYKHLLTPGRILDIKGKVNRKSVLVSSMEVLK